MRSQIKVGNPIRIQNTTSGSGNLANSGNSLDTQISYVAPNLSRKTRTIQARASIQSASGQWLPGMFVTVLVPFKSIYGNMVIPKTAIQRIGDQWVV
ncbi:MAG: hypothetical protein COB76_01855, partial [Alphaproteobacteria bacterium]